MTVPDAQMGGCPAGGGSPCTESRFDPTTCARCGASIGDGSLGDLDFPALVAGAAAAHLWADAYTGEPMEPASIDSETAIYLAERIDGEDPAPWTEGAIAEVLDVVDWARSNADGVRAYMEATGRDASHVGHDFALSRSGHGTGLWDRGAGEIGNRLHRAARVYGDVTLVVTFDADGDVAEVRA